VVLRPVAGTGPAPRAVHRRCAAAAEPDARHRTRPPGRTGAEGTGQAGSPAESGAVLHSRHLYRCCPSCGCTGTGRTLSVKSVAGAGPSRSRPGQDAPGSEGDVPPRGPRPSRRPRTGRRASPGPERTRSPGPGRTRSPGLSGTHDSVAASRSTSWSQATSTATTSTRGCPGGRPAPGCSRGQASAPRQDQACQQRGSGERPDHPASAGRGP